MTNTTINTSYYYDEIKEEIMNQLENLDFDTLVYLWNDYVREENMSDEIFNVNDEDLEMLSKGLIETLNCIRYGDFSFNDDYFSFDGYDNYVSFNRLRDTNCPIDLDELADWLTEDDNFENYTELDLSDFLDELEEEEESDDDE